MSYHSQDLLRTDTTFQARVRSCVTEQSNNFINDARPDFHNLASDALRGAEHVLDSFYRVVATAPGLAAEVENPDGTIDQSKVSDLEILSATQSGYPMVVSLWYMPDGLAWSGAWQQEVVAPS